MKPSFFKTQKEFRKWLIKNHKKESELIVGFYKVSSNISCMSWSQSVDEALCFGWIDGVRTSIDQHRYQIRFTKRKPTSIWSTVNIKKVESLTNQGLMHPAGLEAFQKRKDAKSNIYAHEKKVASFTNIQLKIFKANKKAWNYFELLASSYKKLSIHWVTSAKLEKTQIKRLNELIIDCTNGTNQWKDNKYKLK